MDIAHAGIASGGSNLTYRRVLYLCAAKAASSGSAQCLHRNKDAVLRGSLAVFSMRRLCFVYHEIEYGLMPFSLSIAK
jgi:hypothetical protein